MLVVANERRIPDHGVHPGQRPSELRGRWLREEVGLDQGGFRMIVEVVALRAPRPCSLDGLKSGLPKGLHRCLLAVIAPPVPHGTYELTKCPRC